MSSQNQQQQGTSKPKPKSPQKLNQEQQSILLIKKAWREYRVTILNAASETSKKAEPRPTVPAENPDHAASSTVEARVKSRCMDVITKRAALRSTLNEIEADVKDNAKEFKALTLMWKSSGSCLGSGNRKFKRRKVENGE